MPTLTLKGLPDNVYRALKERAAANRRSLNSEVLTCLEQAVGSAPLSPEERIARIGAWRAHLEARGLPPLTEDVITAAKNEGRP